MALVASPWSFDQSEKMLMDQSRFRSQQLHSGVGLGSTARSIYGPSKALVQRKRSWEKAPAPPRNRKRVFSYVTDSEMETYRGHVRAPGDAVILFEACRLGLLPRVQRRLSEKERQSIRSGSVFVWDEREAGMRRWTDGKSWSASRVSGSFLTYREMEGKRGGGGNGFPTATATSRSNGTRTPESGRGNDSEIDSGIGDEGPDGYRYKPDGLMKQSFSITTSSGQHLHLISYYSRSHPDSQQLPTPSTDSALRHIRPAKGMYPESTVHEHQNIPAVTRSPMAPTGYETVPQMANYARPNPPHWSPQAQQYGWGSAPGQSQPPAPPAPPPPQAGYPYQYGPPGYYVPQSAPPQNHTNGQPLSSPHTTSAPSPHTIAPPNSHYDDRRPPPASRPIDPSLPAFDSRRPPHQESSFNQLYNTQHQPSYDSKVADRRSLPANDSRQHPAQYQSHPSQAQQPYYGSSTSNPSPGSSAPNQYQPHHSQSAQQPSLVSPSGPPGQPHYSPSTPTGMHQIDPRLGLSPSHTAPYTSDSNRGGPKAFPKIEPTSNGTSLELRSSQSASAVPSIGALMNGASDHGYGSSALRSPGNTGPPVNGQLGNVLDRTSNPGVNGGGGPKKEGPQDIPSDKVGFSEDMRALKVLDKGFR